VADENYSDFWIKELLPEYKCIGEREFLSDDECGGAQAVAKSCEGVGFTTEAAVNIREWLSSKEISAVNTEATDCAALVHRAGGKIAGVSCTGIYGRERESGAVVWVRMIAVAPEFQGQGIGRNLLMQTLQYGVEHGAKRAFLHVDLANAHAVKLYESAGFIRD